MVEPAIFGPLDAVLAPYIEYVVFALVLVNLGTRYRAHRRHVEQAASGAEAVSRHLPHEASNVLLLLGSFYYLTVHYHAGFVLTLLVLSTVVTDFFEFEARLVEARQGRDLDAPKGALFASLLVLSYAFYVSLFFVVEPLWNAVV